jgi:hypothetical protein
MPLAAGHSKRLECKTDHARMPMLRLINLDIEEAQVTKEFIIYRSTVI